MEVQKIILTNTSCSVFCELLSHILSTLITSYQILKAYPFNLLKKDKLSIPLLIAPYYSFLLIAHMKL